MGLPRRHREAKARTNEIPPLAWPQAGVEVCNACLCQQLIGVELHAPIFVAGLEQQCVDDAALALNLSLYGPCQSVQTPEMGPAGCFVDLWLKRA